MKAYYGQHTMTGKWYAMTHYPQVTQWGATEQEAKDKLNAYLEQHHNLTVVGWEPFAERQPGSWKDALSSSRKPGDMQSDRGS